MLIKPQAGKGLGRFTAWLLNLEMECSIRPSFLSVVVCICNVAVDCCDGCQYQTIIIEFYNVHCILGVFVLTPLVVIKAQPKAPQLRDGGHVVILF